MGSNEHPAASCACCDGTRTLTTHHIHPSEYKDSYPHGPDRINEKANLVILCAGCHSVVHDARPYHAIARDVRNKIRRKPKVKGHHDQERREQSLKDQKIQQEVWKRLLVNLQDKKICRKIEEYRSIIRIIQRIHKSSKNKMA